MVIRNKALFNYVVLPLIAWTCIFFIAVLLLKQSYLSCLGVVGAVGGSLIFIIGPYKGKLLNSKNTGYIAGRIVFSIGLLLFAGIITIFFLFVLPVIQKM